MAETDLRVKIIPDLSQLRKGVKNILGDATGGRAVKGDDKKSDIKKREKESNKILKQLKGILKFVSITAFVSSVFLGLMRLIEPVFKLLGIILTLLFLPLIPILKPVLEELGKFARKISTSVKSFLAGDIDLSEFFEDVFGGLEGLFDALRDPLSEFLLKGFEELGEFIGENADAIGKFLFNALVAVIKGMTKAFVGFIREFIKGFGDFRSLLLAGLFIALAAILAGLGGWIVILIAGLLAVIITLFPKLKELFTKLIDGIKNVWNSFTSLLGSVLTSIINKIKRFLSFSPFKSKDRGSEEEVLQSFPVEAQSGGFISKTGLAVIHKGETVIPAGGTQGITININNPSVRSEQDIKKIADAVSRIMAKQKLRGFASNF